MSKDERTELGFEIMGELLGREFAQGARKSATTGEFGCELALLGSRNAFGEHWSREALDRRSRSFLTLGILIGGKDAVEIGHHVRAAIANGITVAELEQIVYHTTAYAGFPAANQALRAIKAELQDMRLLD